VQPWQTKLLKPTAARTSIPLLGARNFRINTELRSVSDTFCRGKKYILKFRRTDSPTHRRVVYLRRGASRISRGGGAHSPAEIFRHCRLSNLQYKNKTHKWENKLFVEDRVRCFFHIPLGMDSVMTKNMKLISDARAKNPESIMLMDDTSLFSSDIYIAVDKPVPGAQMTALSGAFLSRVFEGPYQNAGKWTREMVEFVKSEGKTLGKLYFSHTTCPSCAKAYGKNYVGIFAKI